MTYQAAQLATWRDAYRVAPGAPVDLPQRATRDPDSRSIGKDGAQALLAATIGRLSDLQEVLYADRRWSLLVVLQAMDAGGKDSTVKHVFSGVNPQGLSVVSFKPPGPEELAHDFLWRVHRALPARGMIGVFNRSHYEEVVITRVHSGLLQPQRLPVGFADRPEFWRDRLGDIRAFEDYLGRQGTRVVKIFLHVGADEQKERLRARLDDPSKLWKFDPADLKERALWPDYMAAYGEAIAATSTEASPWYIVPADQKWFARAIVADILAASLDALDLRMPEPDADMLTMLAGARKTLA